HSLYHSPQLPSLLPLLFNHPAPTATYTLSLHDALPISCRLPLRARQPARAVARRGHPRRRQREHRPQPPCVRVGAETGRTARVGDRKSTRLNSSHVSISYAVFCLKKKKTTTQFTSVEQQ